MLLRLLLLCCCCVWYVSDASSMPSRTPGGGASNNNNNNNIHAAEASVVEGIKFMNSGDAASAARAFRTALRLDKTNKAARRALGLEKLKGTLDITLEGRPYEIPVFINDTAKELASAFFSRHTEIPMHADLYIAIHNEINAMLRSERAPVDAELQVSRVSPHIAATKVDVPRPGISTLTVDIDASDLGIDTILKFSFNGNVRQQVEEMSVIPPNLRDQVELRVHRQMESRLHSSLTRTMGAALHTSQFFPTDDDSSLKQPLGEYDNDGSRWEWDEDTTLAQQLIFNQQYPPDCASRRFLVYHFDRSYFGLAANIHFLAVALTFGFIHNRTVVTRVPDNWNYAGNTCAAGWECYFKQISNCSAIHYWEPYTTDVVNDFTIDHRQYMYKLNTSTSRVLHYVNIDGMWQQTMHSPDVRYYIPPPVAHRGLLWWRSQITRYIFRPKAFVSEYIQSRWAALNVDPSCVGLHVRHGDKSYDVIYQHSYFGGIDVYIKNAREQVPGVHCYLLSTDDPAVLNEADAAMAAGMGKFTWDTKELRYNGTHVYAPIGVSLSRWPGFPGNDPAVNTTQYALDSIKSIVHLANAGGFVGTATSCFTRLVYQLRVARGGDEAMGTSWTVDRDPRFPEGWFADP